jgi:hypothetical protein
MRVGDDRTDAGGKGGGAEGEGVVKKQNRLDSLTRNCSYFVPVKWGKDMTAEIAILNKGAVALAADSAVTISVGNSQEKIFDSADKLFELSCHDPIAIMINNNMHFMEVPLQVIIKDYRTKCPHFDRVDDAALDFLKHLEAFGKASPDEVRRRSVTSQLLPLVQSIDERASNEFRDYLFDPANRDDGSKPQEIREQIVSQQLRLLEWIWNRPSEADFLENSRPDLNEVDLSAITDTVENNFQIASSEQRERLIGLIRSNAHKHWFPTLTEFRVFGMVGGALKFGVGSHVDIDRNGDRARVIPFAQRYMVERFLYGLDSDIERKIKAFCQRTVPKISEHLIGQMDLDADAHSQLESEARAAERSFLDGLSEDGFTAIREVSQSEIEDMVEFMPKSEMVRMAEALVNLTSIKRRVSRGMETVGGPIDVAIISKAEGFVWVKRKHYFPPELNARYFERMTK